MRPKRTVAVRNTAVSHPPTQRTRHRRQPIQQPDNKQKDDTRQERNGPAHLPHLLLPNQIAFKTFGLRANPKANKNQHQKR